MPPRTRSLRLLPAVLATAAALALTGCSDPAAPSADDSAAVPAADVATPTGDDVAGDAAAPAEGTTDVCAALPVDDLNEALSAFGGPTITAQTQQDGGCLLSTADVQYLITVTPQTVDEVVAGRETTDVTAGATAVTVDGDRTWIQDCGSQTCVGEVVGGSDPVNLVDLITVMNPVTYALTS